MCGCVGVCVSVCVCVCACVCVLVHTLYAVPIFLIILAGLESNKVIHTHTHTHGGVHARTHAHTYTYTHTHTGHDDYTPPDAGLCLHTPQVISGPLLQAYAAAFVTARTAHSLHLGAPNAYPRMFRCVCVCVKRSVVGYDTRLHDRVNTSVERIQADASTLPSP